MGRILGFVFLLASTSCAPARDDAPARSAKDPASARPAASTAADDSVVDLVDPGVAKVAAGEPHWDYRLEASADLDGDGVAERTVILANVGRDARGGFLWDDGQLWQVYVEEPDGTRTYVYARFLQMGTLEGMTSPGPGRTRLVTLVEQTPGAYILYEVRYRGPGRAEVVRRRQRDLNPQAGFARK
jgi:hypothetical protein